MCVGEQVPRPISIALKSLASGATRRDTRYLDSYYYVVNDVILFVIDRLVHNVLRDRKRRRGKKI